MHCFAGFYILFIDVLPLSIISKLFYEKEKKE